MKKLNKSFPVTSQPPIFFPVKYLPENSPSANNWTQFRNSSSIARIRTKTTIILIFLERGSVKENIPKDLDGSLALAIWRPGCGIKKQEDDSKQCSIFLQISWISGEEPYKIFRLSRLERGNILFIKFF